MSLFGSGASLFPSWLLRAAESGSTLLEGLVSYWPLDEISGTRSDVVGTNHLTDNNTVGAKLRGPEGTVAVFTKANSEKLTRAAGAIPATYTFSLWVRPDSATAATDTGILSLDDAGNRGIAYLMHANGTISTWRVGAGYVNKMTDVGSPAIMDTWNHLVFVEDKANSRFDVYINGVKHALGSDGSATAVSGSTIEFGNWFAGPYYGGKMATAGMWNVPLSDSDVVTLLAGKHGLRYADLPAGLLTGLVSYWNLDEQSGVRYDSHGSNDLTDNNTVGSVINAGDAMDGAAASMVAANNEQLTKDTFVAPDSFTVTGWVKPSSDPSNTGIVTATNAWPASSQFAVLFQAANTISALVSDGAAYKLAVTYDSGAAFAGRWSFFAMWFDAADKICHISVNNDTTDKLSNDGALAGTTYRTAATLRVGTGTGLGFLPGEIDEVAVWSRVLSEAERTELYNAGAGRFYNGSDFVE